MSCGHTFCRRCVGGYLPSKCPSCKEKFKQREVRSTKNNVLLIGVVEKCCPDETKMKCHILEKLKADEFAEALRIANEGLHLGKGHARCIVTAADTTQKFVWCEIWFGAQRMPAVHLVSASKNTGSHFLGDTFTHCSQFLAGSQPWCLMVHPILQQSDTGGVETESRGNLLSQANR